MSAVLALRNALKPILDAALEIDLEIAYNAKQDVKEIRDPTWLIGVAADDLTAVRRGLDEKELGVAVVLQQAHPSREMQSEARFNVAWADGLVGRLEDLKALFAPGESGVLRDVQPIPGAEFVRYENSPIYDPENLIESRIFTGVVRLIYSFQNS